MLNCLEKRELLNQSAVSIDKLLDWGALHEESGLINDAVSFYERAGAVEQLEALMETAVAEGDAFLYGRILKALGREVPAETWIALGKRAEELGKLAYAAQAFKKGGLKTEESAEAAKENPEH